jgi:hypothetical protein
MSLATSGISFFGTRPAVTLSSEDYRSNHLRAYLTWVGSPTSKNQGNLQNAGNAILTVRLTHVIARYCQASQTRGCADSAWSIAWRVSVHTPTQAKTPRGGKRRQMLRHAFPTSCETRRSLENCTEQEKQWANEPLERHGSLWRSGPAKDKHRPTPRSADLNLTVPFGHKTVENCGSFGCSEGAQGFVVLCDCLFQCAKTHHYKQPTNKTTNQCSSQLMFSYQISHYACFAALAASLSLEWPTFALHLQWLWHWSPQPKTSTYLASKRKPLRKWKDWKGMARSDRFTLDDANYNII